MDMPRAIRGCHLRAHPKSEEIAGAATSSDARSESRRLPVTRRAVLTRSKLLGAVQVSNYCYGEFCFDGDMLLS